MDFLIRKTMLAWRNRHLLFAEPQPTYQPLSTPEELELLSPDHPDYDPESANRRNNVSNSAAFDTALKEGYGSRDGWVEMLPRWEWLRCILLAFLVAITPSFMKKGDGKAQKKLHPTAWLDGLRGVASLMVVFHHSSVLWYWPLNRGWGSSPEDYHFVQLPIIRLFYSGPAMVAIFFVVSGFSLSYKALSLTRKGRYEEVLDSLSSSVLRRGLRLVLPPATTTFFSMLFTYFGFYGTGAGFSGTASREPPQSPFLWEHLKSWYYSVIGLSDPFRPNNYPGGYNPVYDTNLWTIPVELHGSMVIFTTLLALSRVRGRWRIAILSGIVFYLSYYAYPHLFLFLSGVLLAELHHERESSSQLQKSYSVETTDDEIPASDSLPSNSAKWTSMKSFWLVNFLLALFIISMPAIDLGAVNSPGYILLSNYLPPHYAGVEYVKDTFWIFIAAFYLVFILDNAPFLQSIFTTRIAQYLGRISFALYICHGTFLYTMGWNLSERTLNWTGRQPGMQYAMGVGLTGVVMFPLLFWTADVVAREVDARSVTFARWLSNKISVGN
ncbi:acyltransferase family-domain-containing protein [Leptodontidium sp. MPI-SDFR-AT-0119]|nr:acyltransferase family-domain-containing protein [Leptodontidium sp. MPI-SDFR-AT-0119]